MGWKRWRDVALCVVALSVACSTGGPEADLAADLASGDAARLVEGLGPRATVVGELDRLIDTYGFVVEAGQGAVLTVTIDPIGTEDTTLDTILQVWGPYQGASSPGTLIGHSESGGDGSAQSLTITVTDGGRHLIAFASPDEAEGLPFQLNISCEGTDDKCQPRVIDEELCSDQLNWPDECRHETMVVLTTEIDANTHWDACEVILGNPVTVAQGATLSISPGVTILGEFSGVGPFGDVNLNVDGTLMAEGSEESPVFFRARHRDQGWGGLVLNGSSNILSHVYINGARVGVQLNDGAEATVSDSVIRGGTVDGAPGIAGILAARNVTAEFVRALVRGFERGLWVENARYLFVEDSVIRENIIGVRVDGTAPVSTCDPEDADLPNIEDFVDPVFSHTDIIENEEQGILLSGSDCLIQVEHSNIIANGAGIEVRGVGLHQDSFIRLNNIFANGGEAWQGRQLISYHQAGPMNISDNYWSDLPATELDQCWNSICEARGGELIVESFSTSPFGDAGPRAENIIGPVLQETWHGTDQ